MPLEEESIRFLNHYSFESNGAPRFAGDSTRYGNRAWGMTNDTALKDLLGNSTIVMTWDGWVLYNLTAP